MDMGFPGPRDPRLTLTPGPGGPEVDVPILQPWCLLPRTGSGGHMKISTLYHL